jgi:hypothetical protein
MVAHVAFDLDNTLGFFELTNPLAYLWSPELIENPEQSRVNHPVELSPRLRKKLSRARVHFANALLADRELLFTILRPNLAAMLQPLLRARRAGDVDAVILYSNTGVTYSMELAEYLIERQWRVPALFDLAADHWHPLREADHPKRAPPNRYVEPLKTIETLKKLFRAATGRRRGPPTESIIFVDDRQPKHKLAEQETDGLTYIVPTSYYPRVATPLRKRLLAYAVHALDRERLLGNEEYLHSAFCYRNIPYDFTKVHELRGFPDLYNYVSEQVYAVQSPRQAWRDDTMTLGAAMMAALEKRKTSGNPAGHAKE